MYTSNNRKLCHQEFRFVFKSYMLVDKGVTKLHEILR